MQSAQAHRHVRHYDFHGRNTMSDKLCRAGLHPYKGEGSCFWCDEAAGTHLLKQGTPSNVWCVHCRGPHIRFNEIADPPYHWCRSCGKPQESLAVHDSPPPLFSVADFAAYWSMDQHVAAAEWVVRSEWNRMRRGRTHESQSWATKPPEPNRRGFLAGILQSLSG